MQLAIIIKYNAFNLGLCRNFRHSKYIVAIAVNQYFFGAISNSSLYGSYSRQFCVSLSLFMQINQANSEDVWTGVGREEGMYIWRIVKFKVYAYIYSYIASSFCIMYKLTLCS